MPTSFYNTEYKIFATVYKPVSYTHLALQLIYDKAGGSSTKMKELLGTDEALQAALMLTGEKAKEAASDLDERCV